MSFAVGSWLLAPMQLVVAFIGWTGLIGWIGVVICAVASLVWIIRYRLLPWSSLPDDDSGPDADDGTAKVPAPLQPKPYRRTGAIAMEEPEQD